MHCVNNLSITTTWLVANRTMEAEINGSKRRVEQLVASNTGKQLSFGFGRDKNLPQFQGNSTWIELRRRKRAYGVILDVRWRLPYNLVFPTKNRRDQFIEAIEVSVDSLCRYGFVEGDLSIEESISYILEKDINQAFNQGRRVNQYLIKPFTNREYQVFRLALKEFDVVEIWK